MKLLCLLFALLPFSAWRPTQGEDTGNAPVLPWEAQLKEMGYMIMRTSSINLLNGLNFSREQLLQLRDLASRVEKVSAKPPTRSGRFDPNLEPIRTGYRDLEAALLGGGEITPELKANVLRARQAEAKEVRDSLVHNPQGQGCARCHAAPQSRETSIRRADRSAYDPALLGVAHTQGVYGLRGLWAMGKAVPKVEQILNEGQLEAGKSFTCCLLPPQGLSDPVRAGQAAVSDEKLKLFQNVRQVPASAWPWARAGILARTRELIQAKQPGIVESDLKAQLDKVGKAFDSARSMDDTTFEMEKEKLVAGLQTAPQSAGNQRPGYQAALFLLLPGSADIYDAALRRAEQQEAGQSRSVDLESILGSASCEKGE